MDRSRLQRLVLHPRLSKELHDELQQKFASIITIEKVSMYGGAAAFVMHMLYNRLRVTKNTALFAVVPYIINYGSRFVGTKWIDLSME